jgi:hypothetical protein
LDYQTGAAVLVALAAFRTIEFLVNKLMGIDAAEHDEKLEEVKSKVEDLHTWHRPDEGGNQTWKLPQEFGICLFEIRDGIRDLLTEIRRQNGSSRRG